MGDHNRKNKPEARGMGPRLSFTRAQEDSGNDDLSLEGRLEPVDGEYSEHGYAQAASINTAQSDYSTPSLPGRRDHRHRFITIRHPFKRQFFDLLNAVEHGDENEALHAIQGLSSEDVSLLDSRSNQPNYGKCPLHCAASEKIALILLEHGVSPNVRGSVGQTPLHTARSAEVAQCLLRNGARVGLTSIDGSTPLHWAVSEDRFQVVRVLVHAGVDVNFQNDHGDTCMHIVTSQSIAKYLVDHGAKLDIENNEKQIPLQIAASRGDDEDSLALATYLLDASQQGGFVERSGRDDVVKTVTSDGKTSAEVFPGMDDAFEYKTGTLTQKTRESVCEEVKMQLRRVDAKDRWRIVRESMLRGELKDQDRFADSEKKGVRRYDRSIRVSLGSETEKDWYKSPWTQDDDLYSHESVENKKFYATFFQLMVRNRPKLALKMLDRHRTFLYPRGSDKVYSYDLSLIGEFPGADEWLDLLAQEGSFEIVSQEIVQWVLNIRWILFTREVLVYEFFLLFLFVLTFLFTTLYGKTNLREYGNDVLQIFVSIGTFSHWFCAFQALCEILLAVLNIRYLLLYTVDFLLWTYPGSRKVSKSKRDIFWNFFPHVCVATEQILRLNIDGDDDGIARAANTVAAIGSVKLWIQLLSFAEGYEVIGVAMCTIRRMIEDILVYFIVLVVFVFGFSHAIALVFKASDNPAFGTLEDSWIQLFFFVFNLDVGALNDEKDQYRRFCGYFFVAIYMVVVALVILNLIVAVMTNACESIEQNAKEQWLLQRAKLILHYARHERSLKWLQQTCGCSWLIRRNIKNALDLPYPPLPRKNIVTEKSDGEVLLEVPGDWLHAVNVLRLRSRHYQRFRYFVYKKWKLLRRSISFEWPSLNDSLMYFQRQEETEQRELTMGDSILVPMTSKKRQDPQEKVNDEKAKLLSTGAYGVSDAPGEAYGTLPDETETVGMTKPLRNSRGELRTVDKESAILIGSFRRISKRVLLDRFPEDPWNSLEQARFKKPSENSSSRFNTEKSTDKCFPSVRKFSSSCTGPQDHDFRRHTSLASNWANPEELRSSRYSLNVNSEKPASMEEFQESIQRAMKSTTSMLEQLLLKVERLEMKHRNSRLSG